MRVLIIGSGGREHALAWRLRQDDPAIELFAAPGNPGLAEVAECVAVAAIDLPALERFARDRHVDLTIVGPELPLALGIVDRFRGAGLAIFGPTQAAARIETSKSFAKQLMLDAAIPTARAEMHTDSAKAKIAARAFGAPVVVKASGLAAGKGVIVCETTAEADRAIDDMLDGNRFGEAGHEVLVEEWMAGEEVSIFAVTDGEAFVTLPALQDHKRLLAGDRGPNTGGMGAYLPVSIGHGTDPARATVHDAVEQVIVPALRAMRERGCAFTGLLYAGLMLTDHGPRVVEFNCRFGDPETEALMPALAAPLLPLLLASARGTLAQAAAAHAGHVGSSGACVAAVIAAGGYPDTPRAGDRITLPAPDEGVHVFHAGTARADDGALVTAGGRVLVVSATGRDVADAQQRGLTYCDRVEFAGKQLRRDIGWREIARTRSRES